MRVEQACGKFHVVALHPTGRKSASVVPVLWLSEGKRPHVFIPLVDYFASYDFRSLEWKRKAARAVGLFYDFCRANNVENSSGLRNRYAVYSRAFLEAVQYGTIPLQGADSSELFWAPMSSSSVHSVASRLDAFSSYLQQCREGSEPCSSYSSVLKDFSGKPRNGREVARFLATSRSQNCKSFLRHLKSDTQLAERLSRKSRVSERFENGGGGTKAIKRMPTQLIERMLSVGFTKDETATNLFDREDVTAKMIFLLLAGAGLRRSEPLHLWLEDINFDWQDQDRCLVWLSHPSLSKVQSGENLETRRQFLDRHGMLPRNKAETKALRAPWKNIDLEADSLRTRAIFLHESLETLFASYFLKYLDYRKTCIEKRRDRGEGYHPFLFVSNGEDHARKVSCVGNPFSYKAFGDAWERALCRVESHFGEHIPRGKIFGTTPHALRHSFAMQLVELGCPRLAIKKAMHHRHILSQDAYTEPDWDTISNVLNDARRDMDSDGTYKRKSPFSANESMSLAWQL
ncbi:MAG: tyrosine-type recombinase/integrase [Rhodobacteraceae bacterium]|nr:tyrosine-type recombinase/integrase [Paracoccaceae bacterium]